MAAGLGFKTFTTGEVLTAADVNGYLMQGVLVFASTAARDALNHDCATASAWSFTVFVVFFVAIISPLVVIFF